VKRQGRFPELDGLRMMAHIMRGLKEMHDRGIAHRDISLENVLLHRDGTLKISDFGVSCTMVHELPASRERPGKFQYMVTQFTSTN
jgi:protein-serine/threonine kinase